MSTEDKVKAMFLAFEIAAKMNDTHSTQEVIAAAKLIYKAMLEL